MRIAGSFAWVVGGLLALSCRAGADTTVVTDVTIEYPVRPHSLRQAPVHHVVTSSYRDGKVRVESDGGDVVLYNLNARTASWLHPGPKTFTELPLGQLPVAGGSTTDWQHKIGTAPHQDTTVDVKVKPLADEITLAGLLARHRSVHASVSLTTSEEHVGGSFPGFPGGGVGGGGQAGGGFNNGPVPTTNTGLGSIPLSAGGGGTVEDATDDPSAEVDGDFWVTDAAPPDLPVATLLPWYAMALPLNRLTVMLQAPLTDKLGGFPVSTRVTLHAHWTQNSPESHHGDPDEIVVTTQVRSITTGPVSNSLLYPPAGYQQDNSILAP